MNKLTHTEGRIVVKVDLEGKNSHTFEDGTKIRLERRFDNFNMRYTQPVNATVISGEKIPEGAEIILHHNATHDTNVIHNYKPLDGAEIASNIRYFSIPETEAFAWRHGDEWVPLPGYDFALRVFEPYHGIIEGVEPSEIKNVLWVTTGEYKGNVCITLKACDYQLIFQDVNGREGNLIRFRSVEDQKTQRECEVVAIHHDFTNKVLNGKLHVGLTKVDAKSINEIKYA